MTCLVGKAAGVSEALPHVLSQLKVNVSVVKIGSNSDRLEHTEECVITASDPKWIKLGS